MKPQNTLQPIIILSREKQSHSYHFHQILYEQIYTLTYMLLNQYFFTIIYDKEGWYTEPL